MVLQCFEGFAADIFGASAARIPRFLIGRDEQWPNQQARAGKHDPCALLGRAARASRARSVRRCGAHVCLMLRLFAYAHFFLICYAIASFYAYAAPGSKTGQLIDALQVDEDERLSARRSESPSRCDLDRLSASGLVVANDVSNTRCIVMAGRLQPLRSPHLVITNHGAQEFPLSLPVAAALVPLLAAGDESTSGVDARHSSSSTTRDNDSKTPHKPSQTRRLDPLDSSGSSRTAAVGAPNAESRWRLQFDRVLCDVPCSGDGTLRKLPRSMLDNWSPANGSILCMRLTHHQHFFSKLMFFSLSWFCFFAAHDVLGRDAFRNASSSPASGHLPTRS